MQFEAFSADIWDYYVLIKMQPHQHKQNHVFPVWLSANKSTCTETFPNIPPTNHRMAPRRGRGAWRARMRVRVIVKRLAYLDGGFVAAPIAQWVACRTAVHTILGVASSTPRIFIFILLFFTFAEAQNGAATRGPRFGRRGNRCPNL